MKKLDQLLNTMMGAFIGVFIGYSICVIWDYKTNPELYYIQSAPWYTSILVYGLFTIIFIVICLIVKSLIKYFSKKTKNELSK